MTDPRYGSLLGHRQRLFDRRICGLHALACYSGLGTRLDGAKGQVQRQSCKTVVQNSLQAPWKGAAILENCFLLLLGDGRRRNRLWYLTLWFALPANARQQAAEQMRELGECRLKLPQRIVRNPSR
jgi:hypothetical protein